MSKETVHLPTLETFACYDVMKNPQIESDLERFDAHLKRHFPGAR
ncbi:MAG: hypothetical protein AAGD14_15330 [Planctomycetota bacterium]